jgi:hypothetical protein
MPPVADKALIQVNMTINESRQHQMPRKIDYFGGIRRWTFRFDANKASILNRKIYLAAVSCDSICEYAIKHFTAPAIQVATSARRVK